MIRLILTAFFVLLPLFAQAYGPIGPQTISQTPAGSGTKFVSPSGTGSACSLAAPCSITTAVGVVVPGDIVFLRGGTYPYPSVSTTIDWSRNGTSTQRITWE